MILHPDIFPACKNSATVWSPFCTWLSSFDVSSLNSFSHSSSLVNLSFWVNLSTQSIFWKIFSQLSCIFFQFILGYMILRGIEHPCEQLFSFSLCQMSNAHPCHTPHIREGDQSLNGFWPTQKLSEESYLRSKIVWWWTYLNFWAGFCGKILQRLGEYEKGEATWNVAGKH